MLNEVRDTTKHVYWNPRDRCYVALMSETPTCRAEGSTAAEALENVEKAYAQGSYPEFAPRPRTPITRPAGYMCVR